MALALLLAAAAAAAEPAGMPRELLPAVAEVQAAHPGAKLVKLAAFIGADGRARRCPKLGGTNRYGGWGMVFQSPSGAQWAIMECGSRELVKAFLAPQPAFEPRFIGVEQALTALQPARDAAFEAELRLPSASAGFPKGVPFWVFRSAEGYAFVNAWTGEALQPGARKPPLKKAPAKP